MTLNVAASRLQGSGAHALELDGVARHFGALVALSGISMRIAAGERRAVLGSNGAGKTTLFNAITGDFMPSAGRIRFFGEDITDFPVHERIRRGLRRTYQISQLFGGLSVSNSIFLACRGVSRGRFSLLRPGPDDVNQVQAESILHATHLDTVRNRLVASLSHGQQRQLELALALAGAPRFILFDEPAAGLSPTERRDLVEILNALPKHIGYIIIEHDLDVALRVADYV
ncbi:MAG: ATP-binding cassette domain-containing protein, partial [Candidatus Competibacteraceae bacterium]|nr:ATP-binding cassette domain-containing protein [Candidatus Competibacteraceae bacterium]